MKKIIATIIVTLMLVPGLYAQNRQQEAVANVVEKLRKAMIDADKPALERLVSDKLSYGHSGGHIDTKKEFIDKIVSGASDFVTMDLSEQTITVNGRTAIVRHILTAKTNDGGKPGEVHLRIMLVWQKQAGKWRLLGRQAVKIT